MLPKVESPPGNFSVEFPEIQFRAIISAHRRKFATEIKLSSVSGDLFPEALVPPRSALIKLRVDFYATNATKYRGVGMGGPKEQNSSLTSAPSTPEYFSPARRAKLLTQI